MNISIVAKANWLNKRRKDLLLVLPLFTWIGSTV
jgi:hypothetical protein